MDIPKGGYAIIEFCSLGDCVKCNIAATQEFQCLKDSLGKKAKFIASVFCNRQKEVGYFAKMNDSFDAYQKVIENWNTLFGVEITTRIMVLRWDGNVQCSISIDDFLKANFCKKILRSL